MPNKTPDWDLRLGLIFSAPIAFVAYGCVGVYKLFKEFWNEGIND